MFLVSLSSRLISLFSFFDEGADIDSEDENLWSRVKRRSSVRSFFGKSYRYADTDNEESSKTIIRNCVRDVALRSLAITTSPNPTPLPRVISSALLTASALDPHTCWAQTPDLENRLEKPSYENTARMQCTVTPEAAAGCGASPAGMDCAHPQLGPHQKREASTRTRKEMRPRK